MTKSLARAFAALLLIPTLLIADPASARANKRVPAGVVVEVVGEYSASEYAGIKPGDSLVSWDRTANPPANPNPARGEFRSALDVFDVETEHAARGRITLHGHRNGIDISFVMPDEDWDLEVRPQLVPDDLSTYVSGRQRIDAKDLQGGVATWQRLANVWSKAGDHDRAVWLRLNIVRRLERVKNWRDAQNRLDEAIEEASSCAMKEALLQLFQTRERLFRKQREFDKAVEAFKQILAVAQQRPMESCWTSYAFSWISYAMSFAGRPVETQAYKLRALEIAERLAPESLLVYRHLIGLGVAASELGDLAGAEQYERRALAMFPKLRTTRSIPVPPLINLGYFLIQRGDLAGAEQLMRQALRAQGWEPTDTAVVLSNLADIAFLRGDFEEAEKEHLRELLIRENSMAGSPEHADALSGLGDVAASRADFAKAESYYERALAIREKISPDNIAVGLSLRDLGRLSLRRNDLEAAQSYLSRALATQERITPEGLDTAESLNGLGDVAVARGDLAAAKDFYERSLAIREKLAPASQQCAETLRNLGLLHRRIGNLPKAADFLRRAVDALESQMRKLGGTEEVRTRFGANYAEYYQDYVEVLIELNRHEDAFNTLERSRARSLLSMLAERDLVFATDIPANLERERKLTDFDYDRTQGKLRELNPKENAKEIGESLNHLRELRQQQEEIAERIKTSSPKYASLRYPQPLELKGAQAALDLGTLLLSYCVGREKSFLFVVSADPKRGPQLSVITLSVGEKSLRESVEAFRKLIEWNKPSPDLVSRGRSLYDALIRPAEGPIEKSDRVLIIPDGPLHTLPFGALIRDIKAGKPRYVAEWKPLHTAVSATVYTEMKRSRRQQLAEPPILVAGFGDPSYPKLARTASGAKRGDGTEKTGESREDSDQDPDVRVALRGGYRFDPLPHSREEVQSITHLYAPRSEAFLGEEATEERAKSLGKDIPLIHFACHAFVNERFPLDSGLALTIPEHPKDGQDNGLLQAWEIFEKVRIDADLVTLSACETGLGNEMGGEGLIGLTRAFQYAGARSVLASLWKVEDRSTEELMKRFYGYLKVGKTKDEALRSAQIDLIHSPDLSQPIHWAAFQLNGDWR
jgi:CHAT domain-containing protein/uncharacterized protein HemY